MVAGAWLLALALILGVGEAWLRWFPRSDSIGAALTARAWMRQCWRTGPDGYRPHPAPRGPVTVVIIGDSVAAGYGLCDPAERFGDRLAGHLSHASVYVVADNGVDTRRELAMLDAFPRRPDVLVLSYVVNDIEGAAIDHGITWPALPARRAALDHSYLADFVYWRLVDLREFIDVYRRAWADQRTTATHLAELARLFDRGIPVVVIIWPVPWDPETTRVYADPVAGLARSRGSTVIDVGALTQDLSMRARTINRNDAHPSAEVHRRVADALAGAVMRVSNGTAPGARTPTGEPARARRRAEAASR